MDFALDHVCYTYTWILHTARTPTLQDYVTSKLLRTSGACAGAENNTATK